MQHVTSHESTTSKTTSVSEAQKLSAIKTLAIVGFIATIAILVWLAVMVVRLVPDTFATLASIAQSVSSPSRELTLSTEKNLVDASEPFAITWTKTRRAGTYGFSYGCMDGLAGSIHATGSVTPLSCDTWVPLPDDHETATLSFTSEKRRFSDVPLKVRFIPQNGETLEKSVTVTIVNATIADAAEAGSKPAYETPVATTTPIVPANPAPQTPARPTVAPQAPVSNPNGYTDLAISHVGVGTYDERTKAFVAKTTLDNDGRAALRFVVTNIGTKTSGSWSYKATVPTSDADTYRSATQSPLIPGERAVVTVLFGDVREKTGTVKLSAEISATGDTTSKNDSFDRSVRIVD